MMGEEGSFGRIDGDLYSLFGDEERAIVRPILFKSYKIF
jgi:hypothetical protein